jgi:hypothetical protein
MPRVLLINPWIHDVAAYDLWLKPVGLQVIGTMLRSCGITTSMIDCLDCSQPAQRAVRPQAPVRKDNGSGHFHKKNLPCPEILQQFNLPFRRYGIAPEALRAAIAAQPRPDAVFVGSMMTYWYTGVIETIAHVRDCLPDVPVFLGGVYASLCPEHARANSTADRVFCGECTPAILEQAGFTVQSPAYAECAMPDCSLQATFSSIAVLSSRGCPNRCVYCASHLLYRGFEQYNPAAVVTYIREWYRRTGARDFVLYDDALLINTDEHFMPLARGIAGLGLPIRLHAPNGLHVRHINDEIARLLKAAGCATIRLGFESAEERLQEETGGKVSNDDYVRAARALLNAGFTRDQVGVYILAGLPGQSAEQIAGSISFVHASGLRPFVSEYSPIPGTALWDTAVATSPFPIAQDPLFHNNSLLPCRWEGCTPEDVHLLKRFARRPEARYLC